MLGYLAYGIHLTLTSLLLSFELGHAVLFFDYFEYAFVTECLLLRTEAHV